MSGNQRSYFLDERKSWKDLYGVVKIETEITEKSSQKTRTETRYYITSSKAEAKVLNEMIRGHWSVETTFIGCSMWFSMKISQEEELEIVRLTLTLSQK